MQNQEARQIRTARLAREELACAEARTPQPLW